jgi:hypothetical protein
MTFPQIPTKYQNASTDFNRTLKMAIQELSPSLNANRTYIQFETTG